MKRILTMIVALALVLCMTTSAMALVLRPGDTGANVIALQQALNKTGLFTLNVDGKYGPATTQAVKMYQQMYGLKVDGKAGPQTLGMLGYVAPGGVTPVGGVLKVGCAGTEVVALQQALAALNYPVGTIDGKYGAKTYRAVVLFQQLNGLKADGKAGPLTQAKLNSGSAIPYGGTPIVTPPVVAGNVKSCTLSTMAPHVGETVSAYVVPATATVQFVWYREDGTPLGSGDKYTVQKSDLNTRIYCVATGIGASTGTVSSMATSVVTLTAADAAKKYLTGTVSLPTEVAVDSYLTPNIYLNPEFSLMDLYYSWYVNNVMVASTKTLYVDTTMIGKDIRLVIKAQDETILGTLSSNYCTVRKQTSDSVQGGTGDGETTVIKTIHGYVSLPKEAEVGAVLTPILSTQANVIDNKLNAPAEALVYTWYQNGVFIGSYKTLKVTDTMVGKDIHVVVSAAENSGYKGSIGSNYCNVKTSVIGTNTLLNGKVVIKPNSDRVYVGSTVYADVTGLNSTNVTYKWTVDGKVVSTKVTCTVTEDLAGKDLYVTVTAVDGSGYWGEVTSAKCFIAIP